MKLTEENRVSIEGYLKIALVNLENNIDDQPRPINHRIDAIAFILDSVRFPFVSEDAEFIEEVNDLRDVYQDPQDLLSYLKKNQQYAECDKLILEAIRSTLQTAFLIELATLCPAHTLLAELGYEENSKKPEPVSVEPEKDQDKTTVPETTPVSATQDKPLSVSTLKRELGIYPTLQSQMPILWLQYPIGSPKMLYTFLKMCAIFRKFNLPSYKILDQEFSVVDAIRGQFDNIIIYLTPILEKEMVEKLVALIDPPTTRAEEVFLHDIQFYFKHHHYPDYTDYKDTIHALLQMGDNPNNHWAYHYIYMRIINTLMHRDFDNWDEMDIQLAIKILSECDQKANRYLCLPRAELENCIGNFYERKRLLIAAEQYYQKAYMRLMYADKTHSGGIHFSPLLKGYLSAHTTTQTMSARKLSILIICLNNLITTELQLGKDIFYINMHIDNLNNFIDQLEKIEPLKKLKIEKREKVEKLIVASPEIDPALLSVAPMKKFPKSAFFTEQIQKGFQFNLNIFLSLTGFESTQIKHIKPYLASPGIEIFLDNLEDAKKLYDKLVDLLASGDSNQYGGHIDIDENDFEVHVVFRAYPRLVTLMEEHKAEMAKVTSQNSLDIIALK